MTETIALSGVNPYQVSHLLRFFNVACEVEEPNDLIQDPTFTPYIWDQTKTHNEQAPAIIAHLYNHIGGTIESMGFQLKDSHTEAYLFFDSKVGELIGGSDAVITPKKLNKISYNMATAVMMEWRNLDRNTVECESKAILKLLTARCMSNQPFVSIILTDLNSGATIFQTGFSENYSSIIISQINISLAQICPYILNFLDRFCVNKVKFLDESKGPVEKSIIEFQRAKSNPNIPIALEHLMDALKDNDMEHRRLMAIEYFRSLDGGYIPIVLTHPLFSQAPRDDSDDDEEENAM